MNASIIIIITIMLAPLVLLPFLWHDRPIRRSVAIVCLAVILLAVALPTTLYVVTLLWPQ